MPLVEEDPNIEGDEEFCDDYGDGQGYSILCEAHGADEVNIICSVLGRAGIPCVVGESGEPGPAGDSGKPAVVRVPKPYLGEAARLLATEVYAPLSELSARALEMKLLSGTVWTAVWLVVGFCVAYFLVPDDWDQTLRYTVCALAGLTAAVAGKGIMRHSRRSAKKTWPVDP